MSHDLVAALHDSVDFHSGKKAPRFAITSSASSRLSLSSSCRSHLTRLLGFSSCSCKRNARLKSIIQTCQSSENQHIPHIPVRVVDKLRKDFHLCICLFQSSASGGTIRSASLCSSSILDGSHQLSDPFLPRTYARRSPASCPQVPTVLRVQMRQCCTVAIPEIYFSAPGIKLSGRPGFIDGLE